MGQGSRFGGLKDNSLKTRGTKFFKDKVVKTIIENDNLLKELIDCGTKVSAENVIFTAKDTSGQIVWLEKGNSYSGYAHIEKHRNDFVSKHHINPIYLKSHLKRIITKGKIVSSRKVSLKNGKLGIEKIYVYKNKYYTLSAIGTNGYIVSMYPINGGK